MIHVTPAAASKITELLTDENKLDAGLRVFVQGGGCSGFQYGLMIDEGEGDASTDAVIESKPAAKLDPSDLDPQTFWTATFNMSDMQREGGDFVTLRVTATDTQDPAQTATRDYQINICGMQYRN